jgi:O-6-methylguanine DNA methyltransferase
MQLIRKLAENPMSVSKAGESPYRSPAQLVAEACSENPVAVIVPCHRVIRSDGSIGGYRWGVGRKRQLLAREAAVAERRILSCE